MRWITLCLFACACAPYDPYGSFPTAQVEVEGYALVVQQDPRNPSAWAANIDPSRQVVSLGYDPLTRRRVSIAAIEQVTGCDVLPETVTLDTGRAVFAVVNC